MKRGHINLTTKLASALLTMKRVDENGQLVPIISYEESKGMTPEQIISRFEFQHYPIPHSQGGPDHHSNLMPMEKVEHRRVTAKVDIPQIAKTKRVSAKEEEFRRKILTPRDERPAKKSRWGSRKFQTKGRIRS